MLKPVLQEQKCSTDNEVKQATIATLHKMLKWPTACIWEAGEVLQKKCIACEGCYFKKETVVKLHKSSDCE
jgi:hypothetical protein